jgi:hypothetical protein
MEIEREGKSMKKLFLMLLISFLSTCKNTSKNGIQFLPILIENSNIELNYPQPEYVLELGKRIDPIVPTFRGEIRSCEAIPILPAGLGLSDFCVITGTPFEESISIHTMIGRNPTASGSKTLSLIIQSQKNDFNQQSDQNTRTPSLLP